MQATPDCGATAARRILLIEDDLLSLKLMRDLLKAHGYEVAEAVTGPSGLAAARQERPDLIVMDIGLPGMDGVEVTRLLKAHSSMGSVPVLAVTAYAMPSDEERMRSAGCDGFMTKPLRFAEFLAEVSRLLAA